MNTKYVLLMFSCLSFLAINPLQAKIPFTHMFHLKEAFQGFEDCHPLIGWTALQKNLIRNLRLNGNFNYKEKHEDDVPNDSVSKLVKLLFPSPSGDLASFAVHDGSIGYIIKKETSHPEIVAMMLLVVKAQKKVLASKGDKRKQNAQELENAINALKQSKPGKNSTSKKYTKILNNDDHGLVECLLDSVKECVEDAESLGEKPLSEKREAIEKRNIRDVVNQSKNEQPMTPAAFSQEENIVNDHGPNEDKVYYPPYLVEQILMAFLCDRFDTREDLLSFSRALRNEKNKDEKLDNFILKNTNRNLYEGMPVEKYMDDAYGDFFFKALLPYDNSNAELPYNKTGYYGFVGNKEDVAYDKNSFSDCVESAFRHFLNILLFDPENKNFDNPLKALHKKIKVQDQCAFQKLLWFYLGKQNIEDEQFKEFEELNKDKRSSQNDRDSVSQGDQNDRFGKVIEDLNSSLNTNKMSHVYYVMNSGKERNDEHRFEVEVGPLNTLAVFENLLGVPLGGGVSKLMRYVNKLQMNRIRKHSLRNI